VPISVQNTDLRRKTAQGSFFQWQANQMTRVRVRKETSPKVTLILREADVLALYYQGDAAAGALTRINGVTGKIVNHAKQDIPAAVLQVNLCTTVYIRAPETFTRSGFTRIRQVERFPEHIRKAGFKHHLVLAATGVRKGLSLRDGLSAPSVSQARSKDTTDIWVFLKWLPPVPSIVPPS